MKRRDFLRYGAAGLAGISLGGANLSWLIQDAQAAGTPWKFGVMADTQWGDDDNGNDGTCAIGIINQINSQFINHGVKFVIQVGDLVEDERTFSGWTFHNNLRYRARAAEALYNAGIGFFPVRGNHEPSGFAANDFIDYFEQTRGRERLFGVSAVHDSNHTQLKGLSYAIDYNNVRIILIDQFIRLNHLSVDIDNNVLDQIDWMDGLLENRPSDSHAFVMAHKNLVGQSHDDCLLGSGHTSNSSASNQFIGSLQANKVGYYMGGHDHMHHRSIVTSPDGGASVEQIIGASCSYKFYGPSNNYSRENPLSQELYTIGYYIFTVDGPWLTVDFYSSSHGGNYGDVNLSSVPNLTFYHRERFGYSLNGKSFTFERGESYTTVEDTFEGTTAKIMAGADGNDETDKIGRPLAKDVRTGWKSMPEDSASAVLKIWGMADNLSLYGSASQPLPNTDEPQATDIYALSMSYEPARVSMRALRMGFFGLKAQTENGEWVDAVDLNSGGGKQFVFGPWQSNYGLGTYGVDPFSRTVWAVLNHEGPFVAA